MKATITSVILLALSLSGCANQFVTRAYDASVDAKGVNGVTFYEPRPFKLTYEFTQLTDEKGNIKGIAGDGCERVIQKEEIVVLPDYSHPKVIINKPSQFSSGKFGLSMDKGMLTAVNLESTPPTSTAITALGEFTSAAVGAAAVVEAARIAKMASGLGIPDKSIIGTPPPSGKVACNSAPVISGAKLYSF